MSGFTASDEYCVAVLLQKQGIIYKAGSIEIFRRLIGELKIKPCDLLVRAYANSRFTEGD